MVYGAIDLHSKHSRVRIIDREGQVLRDRDVVTDRRALVRAFADVGFVRILLEAGTESEWVAQCLEAAGFVVIVADPNFAPMYGELHRRVKTDQRDVAALAEANRRGWYRASYRASAAQRAQRQVLRAREQLVQVRTGTISVVRALLRQQGYRAPQATSTSFAAKVLRLELPEGLAATVAPLARTIAMLSTEIRGFDERLAAAAATDPVIGRLQTVPGIGVIVASAYRAFVDDVTRFRSAAQVSAAIGLVPSEDSSADRRHRGHITKSGPSTLRSVLVQAAWVYWRVTKRGPVRAWVDRLAARRGKRIAVVALARRLSRVLYAIWRDETVYQEMRAA
jgi:transposase